MRAVIMSDGGTLSLEDLDLESAVSAMPGMSLKEVRENAEREALTAALRRARGKITQAAKELQISRPTLYELMEKLDVSKDSYA